MTCRSAGLFVFEVSGPLALTGLVARIRLIPLLVPLPAVHPVAAYSRLVRRPARSVLAALAALAASVVGLVIVGAVAALFVGPVDSVVGWVVVAGSEVSPGALRAFSSQIHS